MEIKVNQISETDFRDLDCYTLFEDKLLDRTFGVISDGAFSFKFGWQSDTINPFTLRVKEGIYLIGIDLNLLIFDFHNKKAILNATLDYFFYDAKIYEGYIYVITELEVLKISLSSFNIVEMHGLPDYFDRIEFKNESAEIYCLNGETLIIK